MKKSIELIAEIRNHLYIAECELNELHGVLDAEIDKMDCNASIVELDIPRKRMKNIMDRIKKESEVI